MTCIPWISQIQIAEATCSFTNKFLTLTSHSNYNVWTTRCTCGGTNKLEAQEAAREWREEEKEAATTQDITRTERKRAQHEIVSGDQGMEEFLKTEFVNISFTKNQC